jgi:hypothetical protein
MYLEETNLQAQTPPVTNTLSLQALSKLISASEYDE